jgi:hypothetical protein
MGWTVPAISSFPRQERPISSTSTKFEALSTNDREKCLALLSQGKVPAEIGRALCLPPKPRSAQPGHLLPII